MSATPQLSHPDLSLPSVPRKIEKSIKGKKDHFVIGVDEAGRGPLAGPVVAAAFTFWDPSAALPSELTYGVTDSKQVSEEAREFMYENHIRDNQAVCYKVSVVNSKTIDKINILQATFLAMTNATNDVISEIRKKVTAATFSILIDGNKIPPKLLESEHATQFVIKGDSLEFVIAAASICAKVERDKIMRNLDVEYPMYGFAQHKGYPTGGHVAAISKHGPCAQHRMTFAPLKTMKKGKPSESSKKRENPDVTSIGKSAREERLIRRNIAKS